MILAISLAQLWCRFRLARCFREDDAILTCCTFMMNGRNLAVGTNSGELRVRAFHLAVQLLTRNQLKMAAGFPVYFVYI